MRRLLFISALFLGACHGKQEVTAPPPPLRPEPEAKEDANAQKDCEPTEPTEELKPIGFDERSIPEGQRLADQAYSELNSTNSAEVA